MSGECEFVIGQEMAAAVEADERLRARRGEAPSPLPPGGYDAWGGQSGLLCIGPLPYDE